jgi:lactoylglutathione lyase
VNLPELLGQIPSFPIGLIGSFELAIDFPVFTDVDHEFDRIIKACGKLIYPLWIEPWGMRSSMIADPEGNLIEIGSWNKERNTTWSKHQIISP